LDQQILEEDIVFVTFYFYSLQISDLPNDVKCIVLAHGYSTASSLDQSRISPIIVDITNNLRLHLIKGDINRHIVGLKDIFVLS
jgi:hypothetical protein